MDAGATAQWMDAVVEEGVEGGVLTLVAGEHERSPQPPGEDVCQTEVAESSMSGVADSNSPSSLQASGTSSGLHQSSFVPLSPVVSSPALSPRWRPWGCQPAWAFIEEVIRNWYPVGDTCNRVVFFWRTVGGGVGFNDCFDYPTEQLCCFDGMYHTSLPDVQRNCSGVGYSTREFARLDWLRGRGVLDWTLDEFVKTGPCEDSKEGCHQMSFVVASLVGLAYAAVDGGRDLWRRSGSWIGIAQCPGRHPQQVWRQLQLLWWVFAYEYGVKSPKPAVELWPHDPTFTYDLRTDRAFPEPRSNDHKTVPPTDYGPQVLLAPSLLHPHESLLRRGSGSPVSAVGIAAPFEVGALTPDAGEHQAYGVARATAMHEAVIRFDRGPVSESRPTQAVDDGGGARDALRPVAGGPEASPGSCDRMLIELPSRRGGAGAVHNGGALTPAAEEPAAGAHSLRVYDVVRRFQGRELEARFLEAAIASEYRARDGILHSLRLVSPGSVGRKQIREGLLAALRLVLDVSRTLVVFDSGRCLPFKSYPF